MKKSKRYTIKEFCEAERISQKELAARLDTNKDAITRGKNIGWRIYDDGEEIGLWSPKGSYKRSNVNG